MEPTSVPTKHPELELAARSIVHVVKSTIRYAVVGYVAKTALDAVTKKGHN